VDSILARSADRTRAVLAAQPVSKLIADRFTGLPREVVAALPGSTVRELQTQPQDLVGSRPLPHLHRLHAIDRYLCPGAVLTELTAAGVAPALRTLSVYADKLTASQAAKLWPGLVSLQVATGGQLLPSDVIGALTRPSLEELELHAAVDDAGIAAVTQASMPSLRKLAVNQAQFHQPGLNAISAWQRDSLESFSLYGVLDGDAYLKVLSAPVCAGLRTLAFPKDLPAETFARLAAQGRFARLDYLLLDGKSFGAPNASKDLAAARGHLPALRTVSLFNSKPAMVAGLVRAAAPVTSLNLFIGWRHGEAAWEQLARSHLPGLRSLAVTGGTLSLTQLALALAMPGLESLSLDATVNAESPRDLPPPGGFRLQEGLRHVRISGDGTDDRGFDVFSAGVPSSLLRVELRSQMLARFWVHGHLGEAHRFLPAGGNTAERTFSEPLLLLSPLPLWPEHSGAAQTAMFIVDRA
jgi:hypothetical protein